MEETWSIGELAERAAGVLRVESQPVNGRVREVPSERLIRWYTTIGLVDPPLTRRGRIAQYGRRHLLQLVAIKRLQAQGRSIAEIQTTLTGATDARLTQVGELHTNVPTQPLPEPPREPEMPRPRFWAEHPSPTPAQASAVFGMRLGAGVTLLLDGASRTPSPDDIEAVLAVAGPLLTVLEERNLA